MYVCQAFKRKEAIAEEVIIQKEDELDATHQQHVARNTALRKVCALSCVDYRNRSFAVSAQRWSVANSNQVSEERIDIRNQQTCVMVT